MTSRKAPKMRSSSSRMNRENNSPWVRKWKSVTDASSGLVLRAWSTSSRPATSSPARVADLLLISKSRARESADPPPGDEDMGAAAPVERASARARLVPAPPPCSSSSTLARSRLIMACSSPLLPGHCEGAALSYHSSAHPTRSPSGSSASSASSPLVGVSARTARAVATVAVSHPHPTSPLCTSSPRRPRASDTHELPIPLDPASPSAPLATPGAGLRVGGTGA